MLRFIVKEALDRIVMLGLLSEGNLWGKSTNSKSIVQASEDYIASFYCKPLIASIWWSQNYPLSILICSNNINNSLQICLESLVRL